MTQISQMSLCVYVKCLPVLVVWTTEIFTLLACWEEQREIGLIWKREGYAWMLGKTFWLIWGQEPNSGQCVIEGFQEEAGQQLQGLLHQAWDVPSTLF